MKAHKPVAALLLALAGCAPLPAASPLLSSRAMPLGPRVEAPYGATALCAAAPGDCAPGGGASARPVELTPMELTPVELTPARWEELDAVNAFVNRTVAQVEDRDNYGLREKWTLPNARGGDCEDMALEKRRLLIARGWPARALLMGMGRGADGVGHAVLVAVTDRGDYVLDNREPRILPWDAVGFLWRKRQSAEDMARWVAVLPAARAPSNGTGALQ